MSISEWPVNIPNIKDGETTFCANDLNPIINSLENRTNWLKDKLNSLSGSYGFTYTDEGFDASCKKGMLIAQDPVTKKYFPASATWSDTVRADGSIAPSWSANVVGILMTDVITSASDNRAYGSIQVLGCISDKALVDLLAPNRTVGNYYLTENGKASADLENRDMPVWCYSYLSSGKILLAPKAPEYGGHSHNYITIKPDSWIAINGSVNGVPDSALFMLDISENGDSAIHNLISSNPNHICLVKNGQEVMQDNWGINKDLTALYLNFNITKVDTLSIHAITPFTANEPIVHSINTTKDNNLLSINNVGGNVFLGLNLDNVERNYYSGYGITSLSSDGLKTGPVIQGIRAGAGIEVNSYYDYDELVPGVITISANSYKKTLTDMNLCNLNQVIIGTSFNGVSYVFPRSVNASLTGTLRIPNYPDNKYQEGEIVIMFQGNGQAISGMYAEVLIQPVPICGDNTGAAIPSSITHSVPVIQGNDVGRCYSVAIPLGGNTEQQLYSDGLLICTLNSSGESEIRVVSVSFRLK